MATNKSGNGAAVKFSVDNWFRTKGHSATTSVRADVVKFKLNGLPTDYTDAGVASLAAAQKEALTVSRDKVLTDGGLVLNPKKQFSPAEVAEMVTDFAASGGTVATK